MSDYTYISKPLDELYPTLDEYIKSRVSSNGGTNSPVLKEELINAVKNKDALPHSPTKMQLYEQLVKEGWTSHDFLEKFPKLNMRAYHFYRKFNISQYQLLKLSDGGIIHCLGIFRLKTEYKSDQKVRLFDASAFYNLKQSDVEKFLEKNLKKRKREKERG